MSMNVNDYIPQRYPIQMIDRIDKINSGEGAEATKLLAANEWYFANQGENPVMPRPLVLECLAQTGVVALLSAPEFKGKNAFFGGIKQAEFKDDFRPGDELHLKVDLVKVKHNVGIGEGTVTRDGKEVANATLIFAIEA